MSARAVFMACLCAVLSPQLHAQPAVARVGVLDIGSAGGAIPSRFVAFREGLRERGYEDGRNLRLEYRWAEGRPEELPRLAGELARMKVDVIFAPTTVAALAARRATATIPIVFAVPADPLGVNLVASLPRPGGNATGLTTNNVEVIPKRLEILLELSSASTVALLYNPADPSNVLFERFATEAGHRRGVAVVPIPVKNPAGFDAAFGTLVEARAGAVLVAAGAMMDGYAERIAALAARHRLPALYGAPEFVRAGGLVSYSASFADNYRRAASYVDRILKGANPAELPVEQSARFDFVINLKAARGLGLSIPQGMLVRASEIIE